MDKILSDTTTVFGVPEKIVTLLREVYKKIVGSYPSYDTRPTDEDILFLLNDIETELGLTKTKMRALSNPEEIRTSFEIIYHAVTGNSYSTISPVPENLEKILQDTIS